MVARDPAASALARLRDAPWVACLLDYDGTLAPYADHPDDAAPDEALLALLRALASRPRTAVHVVSGRTPASLASWLGGVPVTLHAEHGLWSRVPDGPWTIRAQPEAAWRPVVRLLFEAAAARTPEAFVEEKTAGLAWHHRRVPDALGEARARELTFRLAGLLDPAQARVMVGAKIVEVHPRGIHKGLVVADVARVAPPGGVLLAMGDDRTDEDLFAALPAGGVAVHVGPGPSRATVRLADSAAARAWLGTLAEAG